MVLVLDRRRLHAHRPRLGRRHAASAQALRGYVQRLLEGEQIDRPLEQILEERDRITAEYRELLGSDEDKRRSTGSWTSRAPSIRTSRTTTSTSSTGTTRSSGRRCASSAACSSRTGSSPTRRTSSSFAGTEIHDALYDLCIGWATATEARGPSYWPAIVARRRAIYERLRRGRRCLRRPAAGGEHGAVTIMLWGMTRKTSTSGSAAGGTTPRRCGGSRRRARSCAGARAL